VERDAGVEPGRAGWAAGWAPCGPLWIPARGITHTLKSCRCKAAVCELCGVLVPAVGCCGCQVGCRGAWCLYAS
jgi:hypothetical protein